MMRFYGLVHVRRVGYAIVEGCIEDGKLSAFIREVMDVINEHYGVRPFVAFNVKSMNVEDERWISVDVYTVKDEDEEILSTLIYEAFESI